MITGQSLPGRLNITKVHMIILLTTGLRNDQTVFQLNKGSSRELRIG